MFGGTEQLRRGHHDRQLHGAADIRRHRQCRFGRHASCAIELAWPAAQSSCGSRRDVPGLSFAGSGVRSGATATWSPRPCPRYAGSDTLVSDARALYLRRARGGRRQRQRRGQQRAPDVACRGPAQPTATTSAAQKLGTPILSDTGSLADHRAPRIARTTWPGRSSTRSPTAAAAATTPVTTIPNACRSAPDRSRSATAPARSSSSGRATASRPGMGRRSRANLDEWRTGLDNDNTDRRLSLARSTQQQECLWFPAQQRRVYRYGGNLNWSLKQIDLSAYAGKAVQLRWRFGTDGGLTARAGGSTTSGSPTPRFRACACRATTASSSTDSSAATAAQYASRAPVSARHAYPMCAHKKTPGVATRGFSYRVGAKLRQPGLRRPACPSGPARRRTSRAGLPAGT